MRKGRWVTLQLTRYPSHPNLVLPQVAWVEENHQTPAMKTLRARFKKTEVSLRPLRCPVSPDFQAPVPQGLAEEPLGLWNTVLGPSSDPSGSFHSTRPLPVLPRLLSTPLPPRSFCFLSSLSCCLHVLTASCSVSSHRTFAPAVPSAGQALSCTCCCLSNPLQAHPVWGPELFFQKGLHSPKLQWPACFSEDSISQGSLSLALAYSFSKCLYEALL